MNQSKRNYHVSENTNSSIGAVFEAFLAHMARQCWSLMSTSQVSRADRKPFAGALAKAAP